MVHDDDEERLLRSVTEQNAEIIFRARQRAEADLLLTKEELEEKTRELAQSLAMLRATLESTTDGILVTDRNGHVTDCNERFLAMWGLSPGLWKAPDHCRLVEISAEYFKEAAKFLSRIDEIRTSAVPESHDILELDDGRIFERFSRIQMVGEQHVGRVWSFRDITEQKKAEDAVREHTAALQESDRRKDEFLAMLAHELRNPLAPIRSAVQVIRLQAPPMPELEWATDVLERQIRQMGRLIDDLLDVSRITRGTIELRRESVELAWVVSSAVEASRPLIDKWGHDLVVTLPDEPIRLYADPTRLAQVLLNLLNNAAKYMDRGGSIRLDAERENDLLVLRVVDAGIGIPREMLPRIFDLFAQEDRSLERAEGGLGIGLTLVQRLVEQHGGTVEARSDGPGKGSAFVIRLPIVLSPAGAEPAAGGEPIAPSAGARVLVVDDNHDAAETLAMLLRIMGHDIRTAHDGLEAVREVAEFRPEVVFLDLGLPKLNGYEVARRVRAQDGGGDIMLVAVTGWGQEEHRNRSREAGFDQHLTKPVELAALQKLLAERAPAPPRPPSG